MTNDVTDRRRSYTILINSSFVMLIVLTSVRPQFIGFISQPRYREPVFLCKKIFSHTFRIFWVRKSHNNTNSIHLQIEKSDQKVERIFSSEL